MKRLVLAAFLVCAVSSAAHAQTMWGTWEKKPYRPAPVPFYDPAPTYRLPPVRVEVAPNFGYQYQPYNTQWPYQRWIIPPSAPPFAPIYRGHRHGGW